MLDNIKDIVTSIDSRAYPVKTQNLIIVKTNRVQEVCSVLMGQGFDCYISSKSTISISSCRYYDNNGNLIINSFGTQYLDILA